MDTLAHLARKNIEVAPCLYPTRVAAINYVGSPEFLLVVEKAERSSSYQIPPEARFGENQAEVIEVMSYQKEADCAPLTIDQHLSLSLQHRPIV